MYDSRSEMKIEGALDKSDEEFSDRCLKPLFTRVKARLKDVMGDEFNKITAFVVEVSIKTLD